MKIALLRFAAAAGAITAVAALLATRGNAALVGKPTIVAVTKDPVASTEMLKARYRRATSIPFPASDPYTAEKVTLGKKLFFDTRLSAANLEHYDNGGIKRPSRSDQIGPLGLSKQEKDDLVAFMTTMTSDLAPTPVPVLPR